MTEQQRILESLSQLSEAIEKIKPDKASKEAWRPALNGVGFFCAWVFCRMQMVWAYYQKTNANYR